MLRLYTVILINVCMQDTRIYAAKLATTFPVRVMMNIIISVNIAILLIKSIQIRIIEKKSNRKKNV